MFCPDREVGSGQRTSVPRAPCRGLVVGNLVRRGPSLCHQPQDNLRALGQASHPGWPLGNVLGERRMTGLQMKVLAGSYPAVLGESWPSSIHSSTWSLNLRVAWVGSYRSGLEKAVFTKQFYARLSVCELWNAPRPQPYSNDQ